MKQGFTFLGLGNFIADKVKVIDQFPLPEHLANIQDELVSNGGAPFNVLADLAMLDAGSGSVKLIAAGAVGGDADGAWIANACDILHINNYYLKVNPQARTSYTDVFSEVGSGRRTFFHHRGANALYEGLTQKEYETLKADHVHLGYLMLLDRLDAMGPDGITGITQQLAWAKASGATTSIDLVSATSTDLVVAVAEALPYVDYFFCNEVEAQMLTGIPLLEGDKISLARAGEIFKAIRFWNPKGEFIVHSKFGSIASGPDNLISHSGCVLLPPEQVMGTSGAGDAFAAGYLYGRLTKNLAIQASLEAASAVAAASLRHPTCSNGISAWAGCLALAQQYGFSDPT